MQIIRHSKKIYIFGYNLLYGTTWLLLGFDITYACMYASKRCGNNHGRYFEKLYLPVYCVNKYR